VDRSLSQSRLILADLLSESYDADLEESWTNERTASPSRVAVDDATVKINGEWSCLHTAIDIGTELIFNVALFGRHDIDPAAAFLHEVCEKHNFSEAEFLVNQSVYRTPFFRLGLSGQVKHTDRTFVKSGFMSSKCESTVSIVRGWEVGQAHANGLNSSCIIITARDRIHR
jgi:putative transposase